MNESNVSEFGGLVPNQEHDVTSPGAPGLGYPGQYKFSAEELKVLAECNKESFFQRCLPLSALLGFGTYVGIQKGHLRPNARFGVVPKVTMAVIMGYFVGKLSYQQACADKLMALPGSYIGQLLREKRDKKYASTPMSRPPPTMFGAGPNDIYSDAGPGSSLDLDTDRPLFNSDDHHPEAGQDGPPRIEALPPAGQPLLTYDELRKRNRDGFAEAKPDPYKIDQLPPISRRPPPPSSTNKYGDSMD